MVLIDVNSSCAVIRKQGILTSGMVGATAEFRFSEEWEGLSKTVVFRGGSVTKDVLDVNTMATIPHEVLKSPGVPLEIGVYGINADGTVVIPTIWAKTGIIKPGVNPSGDESTDPTQPVWAQLDAKCVALISNVQQTAEEAADNALNAMQTAEDAYAAVGVAVIINPQTLTDKQKAQARANIGALDESVRQDIDYLRQDMDQGVFPVVNSAVTVNKQTLTDDQKAQARANIGAASSGYVDQAIADAIANLPVYNGEVEEV